VGAAALLLSAALGGLAASYACDEEAGLGWRLAAGTAFGLALLALAGFLFSLVLGLGPASLILAGLLSLSPALVLVRREARARLFEQVRSRGAWARPASFLALARLLVRVVLVVGTIGLLWRVYDRAMFETPEGIYTGVEHNFGDLPFHVGVITSFTEGRNLPPEHPELSGVRLTYPFLVDFLSAMLVRGGFDLRRSIFVPNLVLALVLVALLSIWTRRFTGDGLAALLAPFLVLLDGGLGFWLLLRDVDPLQGGLIGLLGRLGHDYTILASGDLRWGNAVVTLFVPQRSFLFGLPLVLVVWTLWWRALAEPPGDRVRRPTRLMAAAGVVAGLLPLVHAHSFATVMAMGACLALLFRSRRPWLAFFVTAGVLAVPQVLWAAHGSAVQQGSFLAWSPGWDHDGHNPVWFWFYNTGLFLPALVAAVVLEARRGPERWPRLRFWLPSLLWFVVPNLLRLSPWIWDNVKFLFIFYVASAPLVALLLSRLAWRGGRARLAAAALCVVLVLSGWLDVWRVASGAIALRVFDRDGIDFARAVVEMTPPRALVLHAPTHDSPVFLTGRRSLLGYPGHIWSQGLDAGTRDADIRAIYQGGPQAEALLARYGVDYVVLGPQELSLGGKAARWAGHPRLWQVGPYQLLSPSGFDPPR
jgi:hypothetical protein